MTEIEKLVEFERLAREAPAGPWTTADRGPYSAIIEGAPHRADIARFWETEVGDYIAAVSPDVVLALLAALKGAETERDRAHEGKAMIWLDAKAALARAEKAEAERDAAVAAVEAERVRLLAIMYRKAPVDTAKLCDETLDRSGRLLGLVRDEARAALASNSGGGAAQSQESAT